eukprot:CAMPEP_0179425726 /NCGR_PEP_ID=MMETSP0799-20121207/12332_1 /TAXON_ID=46947 /ORGANISM="Geminigera cryophila, Strain CCMP2564" /LENGTH=34 /DNA_ID= /DNA_START= /DNA_END= /DNA_ORIENTATION=
MARLLKEVVFEGAAWGCIAEQDPVTPSRGASAIH